MAHHDDLGFGLIWFTGDLACYVFDDERPEGECMTRPKGLLSDHRYLTNLTYKQYGEFLDEHPELGRSTCMDTTLIVGANTLAEEIGMPHFDKTKDPDFFRELLETLYQTYRHICQRTGIDPLGVDFTPKGVREYIFHSTTNGALRAVTDEEITEGLSVAPHRWVSTNTSLPEGAYRRRLTVSRHMLYLTLLSAPTPTGDWSVGDPDATLEMMLEARTESHDILVRGRLKDLPKSGFPDALETASARRYFTGHEVAHLAQSGREMEVLNWWHGGVDSPPALPEVNSLSLADDVILEIMHRSWRENRGTGFWLATQERMHLHHLAKQIHEAGIPVLGYGSGKIVIATAEDREDKAARQEQDTMLLQSFGEYGIQPPLDHLMDHPDLPGLAEHLTSLQALAISGPRFIAKFDDAITRGDVEAFNDAIDEAEATFNNLGSHDANPGDQPDQEEPDAEANEKEGV